MSEAVHKGKKKKGRGTDRQVGTCLQCTGPSEPVECWDGSATPTVCLQRPKALLTTASW